MGILSDPRQRRCLRVDGLRLTRKRYVEVGNWVTKSADGRLAQIMQVINTPYSYDRTAKNSSRVSKGALQIGRQWI